MGILPVTIAQPFAGPDGTSQLDASAPPRPVEVAPKPARRSLRDRLAAGRMQLGADLPVARPPLPGPRFLRLALSLLLGTLAVFTLGAGVVMVLLWQKDRGTGVLSNQLDRAWDLFEYLRRMESVVAFAVVPLATAWAAVATLNVRRATARRSNPVLAAASIPAAVGGVWAVGATIVAPADSWAPAVGGLVVQAIILAVPLFVLQGVATAADGPRRLLRLTYILAVGYLASLQGLGALSTIVRTDDPDRWARLAAFLVIAGMIQIVGAIAVNETLRSIEGAAAHRYTLRHAYSRNAMARAGV